VTGKSCNCHEGPKLAALPGRIINEPIMNTSSTSRLEAFSDGVFAIAITLLVLEIKVPAENELHLADGLWSALAQRWPNYVGYVLSFLVMGSCGLTTMHSSNTSDALIVRSSLRICSS
jgi:hypothetical protein